MDSFLTIPVWKHYSSGINLSSPLGFIANQFSLSSFVKLISAGLIVLSSDNPLNASGLIGPCFASPSIDTAKQSILILRLLTSHNSFLTSDICVEVGTLTIN